VSLPDNPMPRSVHAADQTVVLPDGRTLGYVIWGQPEGIPVLLLSTSPGSRLLGWMAVAASLQVPMDAYRFGVELSLAQHRPAPRPHHRAQGRPPRPAEHPRAGAQAPRLCARCREVFALVQAHRGVAAPC
jgi:hypothetical protein